VALAQAAEAAPIQILWINLVTDGLPGLALSVEPEERDLMRRRPRPLDESIFAHGLGRHVLVVGLLIGVVSLAAPLGGPEPGSARWRTMIFTVLTFAQLVHVQVIRSERDSLFTIGVASNRPLLGAVAMTVVLQLLVVYVPFLQRVFETEGLAPRELALCFVLPAVVLVVVEAEKALTRRREDRSPRAQPA
jgi:Ca2+-transporting ATPase